MLSVTPIYLACAVALYSFMAFTIIGHRRRRRISIGDGGKQDFARIIRGHANFAEYAPLALLSIGVAELSGVMPAVLHTCGIMLLLGRVLHACCFLFTPIGMRLRVAGMVLTFFALWTAAASALIMVLA
ncbi:MAPEG family protein [Thalassospiraceae bacterium LMO-JJ14]|nr:MAPEG family protein [Thalassospiraceae bacterium LMO-JJ14]